MMRGGSSGIMSRIKAMASKQPSSYESAGSPPDLAPPAKAVTEDEAALEETRAQRIVRVLYTRYERQMTRWTNYRRLFLFLGYVMLFLIVLYLQRTSDIAYKVHSTIEDVVLPTDEMGAPVTSMSSKDDVYTWLGALLDTLWQDPVCGDGLCEAPFEYPSYGHFGCRADCGKLSDEFRLTTLQFDLRYDFSHPVGSLPSSELMQQAHWNLCPSGSTPFSPDCYFQEEQTFSQLTGFFSQRISDMPDGDWSIQMSSDLFNKVSGAIRNATLLNQAALYVKTFVAYAAAEAWVHQEYRLLANVTGVTSADYALLVTKRLASKASVAGSPIANMTNTQNYYAAYISANWPELTDQIFNTPIGQDPVENPSSCTIAEMVKLFRLGPTHYSTGTTPASQDLTASKLASSGALTITAGALTPLVTARKTEIDTIRTAVKAMSLPAGAGYGFANNKFVVGDLVTVFNAAGGFTAYPAGAAGASATAPAVYNFDLTGSTAAKIGDLSSAAAFGAFSISYNLATWPGGTDAYLSCSLADRMQEYSGQCYDLADTLKINGVPANVQCVQNFGSESKPYNCTTLATPGVAIAGDITSAAYRDTCELPCDLQTDCNTVCVCDTACSATQVCVCEMCTSLVYDALVAGQFADIVKKINNATYTSSVPVSAWTASLNGSTTISFGNGVITGKRRSRALLGLADADAEASGRKGRALLDVASDVQAILASVNALTSQQTSLQSQMTALKSSVDTANQYAITRANDNTLIQLIQTATQDIQTGQTTVNTKLDSIIGSQQQALSLLTAQSAALSALTTMGQSMATALSALTTSVQNQLSAISVAANGNVVSLAQALTLFKQARRNAAVQQRTFNLANIPCNPTKPMVEYPFLVDNANTPPQKAERERTIGLNNRVIAGMMVHTHRTKDALCPSSKFDKIQNTCTGAPDLRPYGVDPVFRLGTELFDPDLNDAPDYTIVASDYYKCAELKSPTYDVWDPILNKTVNTKSSGKCAELFKNTDVPYAFHHFPLANKPNGFPYFYDINLSHDQAQKWFTYMSQGLFLDPHTAGMSVDMITYNAELRIFASIKVNFDFGAGGSIKVTHNTYTLRVEMYSTPLDKFRFFLEIMFTIFVIIAFFGMLWEVYVTHRRLGSGWKYFKDGWVWVDAISTTLLFTCVLIWWDQVKKQADMYDISLRYDVYESINPDAYFVKLAKNGANLTSVWKAFDSMDSLISSMNIYYAVNGINILLLIARILKRMDFQPRLGVVTRSLALAGSDLVHFALVAGMVFVGYAMMAHLIFGNVIQEFSTFEDAINTCFAFLLGAIDVYTNQMRVIPGLQGVAATLFFWSFELLVFMVLLNFLLAIIVDAFSEVKEQTHETTGVHTEVGQMVHDRWRGLVGRWNNAYIPDAKLRVLLRSWAGISDEAEAAQRAVKEAEAAEDEIKRLRLLGEEIDEDTLRDILLECMAEAPPQRAGADGAGCLPKSVADKLPGPLKKLGGGGSGKGEKQSALSREEEVQAASKYILDRFGTIPEDEGDGEGAGAEGEDGGEPALEAERTQLASALERLAAVQHELAEGQRNLMAGQKRLAEQQAKLVSLMKQ